MENEIRQNTDWLKKLADDASLWEERAFEVMPAVIAYEYKQLHKLAKAGNVYGTMLQMKDVCEIILKYPMILGLCILQTDNKPDDKQFYQELILGILEETSMVLGKWVGKVETLRKKQLPIILCNIINRTLDFWGHKIGSHNDITNWRNQTIGHGVLRSEDNRDLQIEIKDLLGYLKSYFSDELFREYAHVVLMQGEVPLVGANAVFLQNEQPLSLSVGGSLLPLEKLEYIFPAECKIYFFDSHRSINTTFLDYVEGKPIPKRYGFFYELREKLKEDETLFRRVKEKMEKGNEYSDNVLKADIDILLDELEQPPFFVKPGYIKDWFSNQLQENAKGCFMLKMGRGTGKSTFASFIDDRSPKSEAIKETPVVRTYRCFRTQMRGASDFIEKLQHIFMEAKNLGDEIRNIKGLGKVIAVREEDWDATATANLLNFFAAFYREERGKKKLVLVIDGIDEIVDPKIFDCFPRQENLANGVYVLYTTRPDEETEILDDGLKARIREIGVEEDKVLSVSKHDKRHRKIVLEYTKKALEEHYRKNERSEETGQSLEVDNYSFLKLRVRLAKIAGYSFLKLRMLIPVYFSGGYANIDAITDEKTMFAGYLSFLEGKYGDYWKKFLVSRVQPVLVLLGIFYEGLSFEELATLLEGKCNRLSLISALNEIKGALAIEHTEKGNVYSLANESYVSYVQEKYADDIRQCKKELIEDLLQSAEDYDVDFCWNNEAFYFMLTSPKDPNENEEMTVREFSEYAAIESKLAMNKKLVQKKFSKEIILRKYLLFILDENFESTVNKFDIAWAWLLLVARIGQMESSTHDNEIMFVNFLWVKRVLIEASEKSLDEKIAWAWFYYYVYPAILKVESTDDELVINSETDVKYYTNMISHVTNLENELFLVMEPGEGGTTESQLISYCKKLMTAGLVADTDRFLLMLAQCYRLGKLTRDKTGTFFYFEMEEVNNRYRTYKRKREKENPYKEIFYKYISFLAVNKKITISIERFMEFSDIGELLRTIDNAINDISGENISVLNARMIKLMGYIANYYLNEKLNNTNNVEYSFGYRSHKFYYLELKSLVNKVLKYGEVPRYLSSENFPYSLIYRSEDSFYTLIDVLTNDNEQMYYSLICKDYNPFKPSILSWALRYKNKPMLSYCGEEFEELLKKMDSFRYDEEKLKALCKDIMNCFGYEKKFEDIQFYKFFQKIKYKDTSPKEILTKFKDWLDEFSEVPILQTLYFKQYKIYADEMLRLEERDGLFEALLDDKIWRKLLPIQHPKAAYYMAYVARHSYLKDRTDIAEKMAKECIEVIRRAYANSANVDVLPQNGYMDEWAVCHHILANIHDFQPDGDAYYIFDRMMPTEGEDVRSNKYILQVASSYFNHIIMAEIFGDVETIQKYVTKLIEFLSQIQKQDLPILEDENFSELTANVQMCTFLYDLRLKSKNSYVKMLKGLRKKYLKGIRKIAQYVDENQFSIKLQFIVLFLSFYKKAVSQDEFMLFIEKLRSAFDLNHWKEYDLIAKYSVSFEDCKADMDFPSRGWDFPSYEDDAPPKCDSIFFTVDGFTIDTSDEE